MSEDEGEEGRERDQHRPDAPRPVTAAARRERRRAAARASGETSGKHQASTDKDEAESSARGAKDTKRPAGRATTEKKGRPTPSQDGEDKTQKPSLFARLSRFLREVVAELRKVIWPTRKQMITYTSVVLVFVVVMTAFIFGLDYGFTKAMFAIFG